MRSTLPWSLATAAVPRNCRESRAATSAATSHTDDASIRCQRSRPRATYCKMLELSASFRLPTYGLLPLALLVGFIPTRYLLATALNVNLTSTLDEDDALHAESALFNYAVALFLCALFSFVWPGSACALHREVVDEATPSAVHLHKPRAACPASTQATAPCTGRLAWSAEGDGCAASAKCTEPAAPHRTGSLSVSLPPDEDPAASSLASCTSLPATAAATESVEAPAAATVAAADAAVPLPSELNAWPPNSLGSPGVLAQLLALEQGGCECETLEPVGCECATVQGSRASGPANALDWADPELQARLPACTLPPTPPPTPTPTPTSIPTLAPTLSRCDFRDCEGMRYSLIDMMNLARTRLILGSGTRLG